MNYIATAGALLFIAGVVSTLGIITAEGTYPGYSTCANFISDLGATRPPNSIIKQPAATIFALTLTINGVLVIGSAYCIRRGLEQKRGVKALSILFALSGIGALGVAAFNGSTEGSLAIHSLFAFLSFTAGGLAALVSFSILRSPFRYFAVILGVISFCFVLLTFFGAANPSFTLLGPGGWERWITYPVTLWSIGFGGYLMAQPSLDDLHSRTTTLSA